MKVHITHMVPPTLGIRWKLTQFFLRLAFEMIIGILPMEARLKGMKLTYVMDIKIKKKGKKINHD